MELTYGSLFSGIGGIDLGFDRAGWICRWQVEIDDYCRQVLTKHWPNTTRFRDVRTLLDVPYVDCIVGGFPCQDISRAGTGEGLNGKRSGLYYEFSRIICLVRPRVVLMENVAALLGRGLDTILGDLAEIRYDAEWCCIPAVGVGAPHVRDRVFLVAYPNGFLGGTRLRVFDAAHWQGPLSQAEYRECAAAIGWEMASAPRASGVDDGVSNRVERRRALGNAVVPQLAEWIARRIKDVIQSADKDS